MTTDMTGATGTTGLRRLAEAVLSAQPLADVLEHPVRVAGPVEISSLLNRMAVRLGAPEFRLTDDGDELGVFERVLSEHLALRSHDLDPHLPAEEIDRTAGSVTAHGFDGLCVREEVAARDGGPPLVAYSAGTRGAPAVVIISPCGMPARLAERWMRFLARDHHVLTWESRGLFGAAEDAAMPPAEVEAQAGDLLAVMDHFGVGRAHLMCLCGGAVIGLAAAHRDAAGGSAARVGSLSLWHGDFAGVAAAEKTSHQQNLAALMKMGAEGPDRAAAIHPVLCQTMLSAVPPDLAHLVVYPYATAGLLFRYCRLNGTIMETDVTPWLEELRLPVLVVTSTDDRTAHPDGSKVVARTLPDATLHVRQHGDHISLFKGDADLMCLVGDFIDSLP
ncbi:alpha/beta hydrolase [Sphaerisporangium album]|uniref:Alpha/beta hydrolase n=1 Tax=Sphaerisporangium album TaxID=509200 RepID=A0A367F9L2_9ACTN|nr:alpha/beta hydrolase [Sphaerisporangium album]RCG27058.1 alpha/beta hydrolase [Sphaerisporangium album]